MEKLESALELEAREKVAEARECVERAALLLKTLGADFERVGWMLEDMLIYIDGAEKGESNTESVSEDMIQRLANLVNG